MNTLRSIMSSILIVSSVCAQDLAPQQPSAQEIAVLSRIYASVDHGAQELFVLTTNALQNGNDNTTELKKIDAIIRYFDAICMLPLLYCGAAHIADDFSKRFDKETPADLAELGISFTTVSKNYAVMADEFRKKALSAYRATKNRLTQLSNS